MTESEPGSRSTGWPGELHALDGQERGAQPVAPRRAAAGTIAARSAAASSKAAAMPTAPATFSVPARR